MDVDNSLRLYRMDSLLLTSLPLSSEQWRVIRRDFFVWRSIELDLHPAKRVAKLSSKDNRLCGYASARVLFIGERDKLYHGDE